MNNAIKGGEFLIKDTLANDIFIPEDWNEEQLMIAEMCHDFLKQNVDPNLVRIDEQEEGLMPSLLDKAGELGLLGMSVPEEYNGFGKDFVTSMLTTEVLGQDILLRWLFLHIPVSERCLFFIMEMKNKNKSM